MAQTGEQVRGRIGGQYDVQVSIQVSGLGSGTGLSTLGKLRSGRAEGSQALAAEEVAREVPAGVAVDGSSGCTDLLLAGGLAAQATPDVRLDRVQALQAAIASGRYQVSAQAVAEKIVDSMLKP